MSYDAALSVNSRRSSAHETHTLSRRALMLASVPAACARRVGPKEVSAARRVVSLAPNTTEMLFALGLGARVVGVSSLCDFPAEATERPRLGTLDAVSLEAILSLRPDAVVGAPGVRPAVLDRLRALGVRVHMASVERIADVRSLAIALANLCGDPEAGRAWVARFERELARAASLPPITPTPRVLAVVDQRPIVCAGPGSYLDELIRAAGGANALREGPSWPTLPLESILREGPDVILDLCGPVGQPPLARAWSAHTGIPAVRDGRVLAITDPLVTRPGPRAARAVTVIAEALRAAPATPSARRSP
jgi:iron complex transport system substrate-binding protein